MPLTTEQRLARLEAADQIRQLAARYGYHVDSRNIDGIVSLFVDDGRPVFFRGARGYAGGKVLRDSYFVSQSQYTASQHYMCNHVIDIDDDTHAHGIVYAIVRQERESKYFVIQMAYWDKYEKVGEKWLIAERNPRSWKRAAWHVEGVGPATGISQATDATPIPGIAGPLPDSFDSWKAFWQEVDRRGGPGK